MPENKLGLGGKSKSSTQLHIPPLNKVKLQHHKHASGAVTPGPRPTHGHKHGHKSTISEDISLLFSPVTPGASREEDDWLLRTGSLLTYGARETKGQAWLVSRASSTTVTGRIQDEDSGSDDEAEKEEAKWAHAEDRRGSATSDEFSPVTIRSFIPHNDSSKSASHSRYGSRAASRAASRNVSRRGSKVGLALTPRERAEISMTAEVEGEAEDYFSHEALPPALSEGEDSDAADELFIKRSVKTGTLGMGGFVERMMGWSLFTVDDDVEDNDDGNETEMEAEIEKHREEDRLHWKEVMEMQNREGANGLPAAPKTVDGGWVDAAWLLSVASKVLL